MAAAKAATARGRVSAMGDRVGSKGSDRRVQEDSFPSLQVASRGAQGSEHLKTPGSSWPGREEIPVNMMHRKQGAPEPSERNDLGCAREMDLYAESEFYRFASEIPA
eukprot:c2775_g1_i1 orf=477-797(-)